MRKLFNNSLRDKIKSGKASNQEIYKHYDKIRKNRLLKKSIISGATTAAATAGAVTTGLVAPPIAAKLGYVAGVSGGKFVNDLQNRSGFSKTKFNAEQKEKALMYAKRLREKQIQRDKTKNKLNSLKLIKRLKR